jgi:uncharacterized membrane protein YeaQ/YmgE (transglycosylase-associated protein family)
MGPALSRKWRRDWWLDHGRDRCEGVSGFNLLSILIAIAGAAMMLVMLHMVRSTSRSSY